MVGFLCILKALLFLRSQLLDSCLSVDTIFSLMLSSELLISLVFCKVKGRSVFTYSVCDVRRYGLSASQNKADLPLSSGILFFLETTVFAHLLSCALLCSILLIMLVTFTQQVLKVHSSCPMWLSMANFQTRPSGK